MGTSFPKEILCTIISLIEKNERFSFIVCFQRNKFAY